MSWGKTAKLVAASVASTAALVVPGVAQAGIVVAASGPSAGQFPKGKKIAANTRITLKAGDSVTILDQTGTKVLRGAGTFTAGAVRASSRRSTFAALTRQRSSTRVRTGAVRGTGTEGPARSPNLWYVDVTRPGTMCIVDTDTVRLWRPDTASQSRYTVASADGASKAIVTFYEKSMLASWDAAVAPIRDGARFNIRKESGGKAGDIVFSVLPEAPENPEATAEALLARGCTAQLDLLTATLTDS